MAGPTGRRTGFDASVEGPPSRVLRRTRSLDRCVWRISSAISGERLRATTPGAHPTIDTFLPRVRGHRCAGYTRRTDLRRTLNRPLWKRHRYAGNGTIDLTP